MILTQFGLVRWSDTPVKEPKNATRARLKEMKVNPKQSESGLFVKRVYSCFWGE